MVTLQMMSAEILSQLKSNSGYLEIDDKRIEEGLVGEKEEEIFNVTKSFIRFYLAEQPSNTNYTSSFRPNRLGSLMVLCGVKNNQILTASKQAYKMAEKIERALLDAKIGLWREQQPIFNIKNSDGISIFGVSFFFNYESEAGDPNG